MTNSKSQMGPKTERTPGKWYAKDNTVLCQQDNIVAECPKYGCSILNEGEIAPQHRAKQNATFIVKACNLHDELVEVLKLALTLNGNPRRDSEDNAEWDKVIDNIKNLIAKTQEV